MSSDQPESATSHNGTSASTFRRIVIDEESVTLAASPFKIEAPLEGTQGAVGEAALEPELPSEPDDSEDYLLDSDDDPDTVEPSCPDVECILPAHHLGAHLPVLAGSCGRPRSFVCGGLSEGIGLCPKHAEGDRV